MTEYYHQHASDYCIYWDILDILVRGGKLSARSSLKEIKAEIEREARERGLNEEEVETAITYAFDTMSALE